ncbi:MAG TPA: tRNA (N(6)-L-threonylcarbamoyladenosine(37)-C(2))-methylthiotransferase MtaB [Sphaerochaeta sp.]|nr:tRNA (N(6)-L-threonylcarbamoyladenosine(37)-C(2))-methylthiotransferase MtaB [Sphaerochaeta sp.]
MKVCVYTFGCRLNQCESEAIADAFVQEGFSVVGANKKSDLYVVNTCTVTSKAEQKARRMIRKFAQDGFVLITGCYAELNAEELQVLAENIFVVPLSKKAQLLRFPRHLQSSLLAGFTIAEAAHSFGDETASVFDYDAASFSYHSRAYLKVQDGCDNSCAYCRVHVARGKAVSLEYETVIERALALEAAGFQEIMLTGVNLTMYDHQEGGLGGLLSALLPKLSPSSRIRLSSMEPDHIDDTLIDMLGDKRMQPHFHIPIQSGSDRILKRVGRKYTTSDVQKIIAKLQAVKEDPFIAADFITGLPGESEEDFALTKELVQSVGFSSLHVFPFSPRPDTPLYHSSDRIPEYLRDERAKELRSISSALLSAYRGRQSSRSAEVILQNRRGGVWHGLGGNYLDVIIEEPPLFGREGMLVSGRFASEIPATGRIGFTVSAPVA